MLHRLLRAGCRLPSLWRRYWALPAMRRGALWRAAGWVVVVRSALEVFPFRRILKVVERQSRRRLDQGTVSQGTVSQGTVSQDAKSSAVGSFQQTNKGELPESTGQKDEEDPGNDHAARRSMLSDSDRPVLDRPGSGLSFPDSPALDRRLALSSLRSHPAAQRVLWAVRATSRRLLPERPCLTQALVGRYLLAQHGIDAVIQIGVTKDESELKAHAWLEHNGAIILGGTQSRDKYRPFPSLQV